jgi:hypothetical protein
MKPDELQGWIMVDWFITYVGGRFGICAAANVAAAARKTRRIIRDERAGARVALAAVDVE